MGLKGLYSIDSIKQKENGYDIQVTVFAGHRVFDGHFPNQPVVPGVCTLTVIKKALSEACGRPLMFQSIKECKFLSALIPTENLQLDLDCNMSDESALKCVVSCNGVVSLKLSASMTDTQI